MSFNDFGDVINKRQPKYYGRPVFFGEDTAPKVGRLVCFDRTYTSSETGEASTDPSGYRCNRVKYPTSTNNLFVAGVISHSMFGRAAKTGGQWIEILVPGSICMIETILPVTALAVEMQTAMVTGLPGVFGYDGHPGRGSAIPLQVLAALTSSTAAGPGAIFQTTDGSATYTSATKTVSKTNIGQYAAAGDRFVVIDGATTGGLVAATRGDFIVDSVTDADNIVLKTAPLSGDGVISGCLVRGFPKVLAYLMDGEESGLLQYCTPIDQLAASPAPMVGGVTLFGGGTTLGNAVSTATLADGLPGQKKTFGGLGTLTTNGVDITVTSGLQADDSTALAGITIDAANEFWCGEFLGNVGPGTSGVWMTKGHVGATLAAA